MSSMSLRWTINLLIILHSRKKLRSFIEVSTWSHISVLNLCIVIGEREQELIILKAREYDSVWADGQLDDMKIKFKRLEDDRARWEIQAERLQQENKVLSRDKAELVKEIGNSLVLHV